MHKETFDRFIHFGAIGDKKSREQIANAIYLQLQKKSESGFGFANANTDNFAASIDEILSNPTMKELCTKDPELAEKVTQEILNFINKTKKQLNNPQITSNNFVNLQTIMSCMNIIKVNINFVLLS